MIIAIDGPAGAGKSTVARRVAEALGYRYVDTGAMYRAVALAALDRGIDVGDKAALEQIAREVEIEFADDTVLLEGRDVTERIRDADVTRAVPPVSAVPGVRGALAERQRRVAVESDVVMEGRDIGTTIVPKAPVKIYLTASPAERARRRLLQEGRDVDPRTLREMTAAITARDDADASRHASPLAKALDAVIIDSTRMTTNEVVRDIVAIAREAERPGVGR